MLQHGSGVRALVGKRLERAVHQLRRLSSQVAVGRPRTAHIGPNPKRAARTVPSSALYRVAKREQVDVALRAVARQLD